MNKVLSIVIPVFNKYNFTKACLEDLSQLPEDHEIIVVDNGSTDATQKELEKNSRISYLRHPTNLGFAEACNAGYDMTAAPNVLFLNNDIRVKSNHNNWTAELIKWSPTALVGPTMGQLDDNLNFVREANRYLPGNSYMSGWCLASSKEIWSKLEIKRNPILIYDHKPPTQIFSEEFGLAYFEDTDISFRAKKLGISFQIVDLPIVHFGKQTSSQLNTYKLYSEAKKIFIKKWGRK